MKLSLEIFIFVNFMLLFWGIHEISFEQMETQDVA